VKRRFSPLRNRIAVLAVTVLAVLSGSVLVAAPASAATIGLTYPVSGTSSIKKTGSTLELGPGTLSATVVTNSTGGEVTGTLSLPPSKSSFTIIGIVPVSATVTVIPAGPATGTIKQGALTAHAEAYIQLSDISVAGILPLPVGDSCRTKDPVAMDLQSQGAFTVFAGGNVSGAYTIPDFDNCTIFGPILSSLISGPDNAITLTLGKPTQP
jgi:hypothetical protein